DDLAAGALFVVVEEKAQLHAGGVLVQHELGAVGCACAPLGNLVHDKAAGGLHVDEEAHRLRLLDQWLQHGWDRLAEPEAPHQEHRVPLNEKVVLPAEGEVEAGEPEFYLLLVTKHSETRGGAQALEILRGNNLA